MRGTILGTGNKAANKTDKNPCLGGAQRYYIDGTQQASKVKNKMLDDDSNEEKQSSSGKTEYRRKWGHSGTKHGQEVLAEKVTFEYGPESRRKHGAL